MAQDERMEQLQETIAQKKGLEARLQELENQHRALDSRVRTLKETMQKEQADAERLERASLANVLALLSGKKGEQLDRQKREAYAARVKYDAALRELEQVSTDLFQVKDQLHEITRCEREYAQLLDARAEQLKTSGSETGAQLLQWEEQLSALKSQKKELEETIAAGTRAMDTANRVDAVLDDAEAWGQLDLLGGGAISWLAKHSDLEDAQNIAEELQEDLRSFQTKLADVTTQMESMQEGLKLMTEGFWGFADYFLDGLLVDWVVLDTIREAQDDLAELIRRLQTALSRLRELLRTVEEQTAALEGQRRQLVEAERHG